MLTKIKNISVWLDKVENDKKERQRREAIHILLNAIASSETLNAKMAMKGGVLLAIKYSSSRYTIDVDFSTSLKVSEIDNDKFKIELDKQLTLSSESLNYGMACLIQKFKQQPNDPEATTPTFRITVGYANKSDRNNFKSLLNRRSSTVIKIDYSFNEIIQETEELYLSENKAIMTYSYTDLIAEKYRALLQQKKRNRWRSQDVYDLYYILKNFGHPDYDTKGKILDTLKKKSASRGILAVKESMSDPEIKDRSSKRYNHLSQKIYDDLPEFETAYKYIKSIYESLPWES
jgi:hypothetical protein